MVLMNRGLFSMDAGISFLVYLITISIFITYLTINTTSLTEQHETLSLQKKAFDASEFLISYYLVVEEHHTKKHHQIQISKLLEKTDKEIQELLLLQNHSFRIKIKNLEKNLTLLEKGNITEGIGIKRFVVLRDFNSEVGMLEILLQ